MTPSAESHSRSRVARSAFVVLVSAVGLLSGALGAGLVGDQSRESERVLEPRAPSGVPALAAAQGRAERTGDSVSALRLAQLEKRLAELEARDSPREESRRPVDVDPPLPTPEAERAAWDARLRTHAEQLADPAWAASTASLFREDLAELGGEARFEVRSLECRMTSCLAVIRWPDYATAQQSTGALLHHSYAANCGTEVHLPSPGDEHEDEPYEAPILYTCDEWRAGDA